MTKSRLKHGFSVFGLHMLLLGSVCCDNASCDVYFFTYATKDGKTGHSALAVDNYTIYVHDRFINGTLVYNYDTVKTGTLTYFDFWPQKDHFSFGNVGKDTEAKYNRLPVASYDKDLTLEYILENGIPHIKNYPFDGALRLKTLPDEDNKLVHFMDSLIRLNMPFNVRRYNCSDFVLAGANFIMKKSIRVNEFIPFAFSTTPNKLYRKLSNIAEIQIIKDPGNEIKGSFFKERVIEILLARKPK
jgi:hypothetical protein